MKEHNRSVVWFTEEEVPDAEERQIMQDGLDCMVKSTVDLVEFCIAQRQKQFLLVIREGVQKKMGKVRGEKEKA